MEFKMKRDLKPKKKIIKAVNVYSHSNTEHGFGDYIRGCFCMIRILRKKNIQFDMDISTHPVQRWLQPTVRYRCRTFDQITHSGNNRGRLRYIESNLEKANELYTFFCNEFPFAPITTEDRIFIRNKLLPSSEMKEYIQQTKQNWGITGLYNIIHLRCGDSCLNKGEPPNYDIFLREIQQLKQDTIPYVILSDSLEMKKKLRELYPHFIIMMDNPQHTCACKNGEHLKDTIRDFFLFTSAHHVYALSIYGHGSGFSKWACELYNVPYSISCKPFEESNKIK
jgi:hypothetical protein